MCQLKSARALWFQKSLTDFPADKASGEYAEYEKSFFAEASISLKRCDELLAAAAGQGRYKNHQGITVVIDETYIATVLAGLEESLKRMERLVSPTWREADAETR